MHVRSLQLGSVGLGLVALALLGCDDGNLGTRRFRDAGSGTPGGETGAQCSDGIDNDMDGLLDCQEATCGSAPTCLSDAGPPGDGGFTSCDELPFEAETRLAPIDIVWIIDNSGSMRGEASIIQNNMNSFVSAIEASGITDYHVIVITASGFVSVPPPLGTDAARFRFVSYDVQSSDAMSDLIASYSLWSDFLRRDAVMHIVHVTDDESSMSATAFHSMFLGLVGHGWTSHAIASPPGSRNCGPFGCGGIFPIMMDGCSGPNGEASDNGDEYWALAALTGGQQISICTEDWSAAFSTLLASIAVPTAIPCEFDIPEPPSGMEFDRRRVNVVYTPGGGGEAQRFPYVGTDDGAHCPASGADGWYYDDPENPTQIRLCPSTCSRVEADESGRVDIALGCESLVI